MIRTSAGIQARSCLLPKDVRLFTPNVFTLVPNLRFITPAVDVMVSAMFRFNERGSFALGGMLEFTNLGGVIFSGTGSVRYGFADDLFIRASAGTTENIKGIDYFWYPFSRKWIDLGLTQHRNSLNFSLLKYPYSSLTCNISFKRYLN